MLKQMLFDDVVSQSGVMVNVILIVKQPPLPMKIYNVTQAEMYMAHVSSGVFHVAIWDGQMERHVALKKIINCSLGLNIVGNN